MKKPKTRKTNKKKQEVIEDIDKKEETPKKKIIIGWCEERKSYAYFDIDRKWVRNTTEEDYRSWEKYFKHVNGVN